MKTQLKPLWLLVKQFYRKELPLTTWMPDLTTLSADLKVNITSSPVLARFDPYKLIFLKTYWSSKGMGWVLIQPADDEGSIKSSLYPRSTGECVSELTKNCAKLEPIAFGSRSYNVNERNFHLFNSEGAFGQWAITQNRKYLWGYHFYWLCDYSTVKENFGI